MQTLTRPSTSLASPFPPWREGPLLALHSPCVPLTSFLFFWVSPLFHPHLHPHICPSLPPPAARHTTYIDLDVVRNTVAFYRQDTKQPKLERLITRKQHR